VANHNGFGQRFDHINRYWEMPYIKQATFSIWENKEAMKQFCLSNEPAHAVIKKTRKENWYSEDMFVRFRPLTTYGTIKGNDPLQGKL